MDTEIRPARSWDKSPSLSIIFGLSSKTQWLSGLYYADFISFYSPTQLCGGGTTKSNSNELPISVQQIPLLFLEVLLVRRYCFWTDPLLPQLLELALGYYWCWVEPSRSLEVLKDLEPLCLQARLTSLVGFYGRGLLGSQFLWYRLQQFLQLAL